jgi:serine/threonine protein phosphatase PrpC
VNIKTPKPTKYQDSIFTGGSEESFSYENNKVQVSLKKNQKEILPNFNDLIAKNMGTTANILFIKNNYLYFANVGDSIAVMFKNGLAIRLNNEHKVTLPSESSRIAKSGAKIINNRIEGKLNLTRAIGNIIKKKIKKV